MTKTGRPWNPVCHWGAVMCGCCGHSLGGRGGPGDAPRGHTQGHGEQPLEEGSTHPGPRPRRSRRPAWPPSAGCDSASNGKEWLSRDATWVGLKDNTLSKGCGRTNTARLHSREASGGVGATETGRVCVRTWGAHHGDRGSQGRRTVPEAAVVTAAAHRACAQRPRTTPLPAASVGGSCCVSPA